VKATIKVDAERVIGTVDRLIFGHFIEHLGRCIYGGLLDEREALKKQADDLVDKVKEIKQRRAEQPQQTS
jgi:alpha-N-arabinofuranosidase